jgi:hypothetical protein
MNVCNLFSHHFADVVWTGITTRHIRQSLEGRIELGALRDCWRAISPSAYVDRSGEYNKRSLFVRGAYDTTFLPRFSRAMIAQIRLRKIHHKHVVLPCGHYRLGRPPFKYMDAWQICSFALQNL